MSEGRLQNLASGAAISLACAVAGSRFLDSAVAIACGWEMTPASASHGDGWFWRNGPQGSWYQDSDMPPWFTERLDDACRAIPEGWIIASLEINGIARYAGVTLQEVDERGNYDTRMHRRVQASSITGPLVICLASMLARAGRGTLS